MDVGAQATADIMKYLPCPHCGSQARMDPHHEFRWVCGICGGPRVPVEDRRAHSDREREELLRAGQAKKVSFAFWLAGVALTVMGTLLAALGVALATASGPVAIALFLAAAAALIGGIVYVRRANGKHAEAKQATFEAWESVVEALLQSRKGEASARQIAKEMHTTVADVERMMSFLSVDNRVRIEVKDADLVYTATEGGAEAAASEEEAAEAVEAEAQRR